MIISLCSINWLGFITETESVYCAVRTGYLNTVPGNTNLQRLNAKRNVQISHGRPVAHPNVQPMTTPNHTAQLHRYSVYCTFRRCIFFSLQVATDITE